MIQQWTDDTKDCGIGGMHRQNGSGMDFRIANRFSSGGN
jgi:hypothetical protein